MTERRNERINEAMERMDGMDRLEGREEGRKEQRKQATKERMRNEEGKQGRKE